MIMLLIMVLQVTMKTKEDTRKQYKVASQLRPKIVLVWKSITQGRFFSLQDAELKSDA